MWTRDARSEEQVVHDEALTAVDCGDEGGKEEPDEFEHRGRIADPRSRRDRRTVFCPATTLGPPDRVDRGVVTPEAIASEWGFPPLEQPRPP